MRRSFRTLLLAATACAITQPATHETTQHAEGRDSSIEEATRSHASRQLASASTCCPSLGGSCSAASACPTTYTCCLSPSPSAPPIPPTSPPAPPEGPGPITPPPPVAPSPNPPGAPPLPPPSPNPPGAPPLPPPSPITPPSPAPPPSCAAVCTVYRNGASAASDSGQLCVKDEGSASAPNFICFPNHNGNCDGGMSPCRTASYTGGGGTHTDTPGIWATKKCAKKVRKSKCHKKKVQRNCALSCRLI